MQMSMLKKKQPRVIFTFLLTLDLQFLIFSEFSHELHGYVLPVLCSVGIRKLLYFFSGNQVSNPF